MRNNDAFRNMIKQSNKRVRMYYKGQLPARKIIRENRRHTNLIKKMIQTEKTRIRLEEKQLVKRQKELSRVLNSKQYKPSAVAQDPYKILSTAKLFDTKCVGLSCMPYGYTEPVPTKLSMSVAEAWGALKKSWLGYKIALDDQDEDKLGMMVKYAVLVQKFNVLLELPVEEFNHLSMSGYGEKYAEHMIDERKGDEDINK